MTVNITERQMQNQYGKYVIDMDRVKQELKKAGKGNKRFNGNDTAYISKDGRNALENKMQAKAIAGYSKDAIKLSPVNSFSVMNDFENMVSARKEKGIKNNAFDFHASQMLSAYNQMKDNIEKKYAGADKKQEYYIANDGSIQELTQEKEMEMLNKAYENHSRFMAESTGIWSNLQYFKPQITYNRETTGTGKVQPANSPGISKSNIKTQAFKAFMSALDNGNTALLPQQGESLKNIKLNLDIPDSIRNELNQIWDWHSILR